MKKKVKILYITCIDMDKTPTTGSSVRPQKMLQAFYNTGCEVKLLSGLHNHYFERKKRVKEVMNWLDEESPDLCYVEPAAGPFLCDWDLKLLKKLKKKNINIGLFYRDAYWKFPELYNTKKNSIINKAKTIIITLMHKRDLKVLEQTCSHIYFPSLSMSKIFGFCNVSSLPSGTSLYELKSPENKLLTGILVGGANKNFGTYMLLDALKIVNQKHTKVKLIYICPKKQWDEIDDNYKKLESEDWLELHFEFGEDRLKKYYNDANFAIIASLKNTYHNFGMPVKLFEYLSYCKPILATDCQEVKKFIESNKIGIIVQDKVSSLVDGLNIFINDRQLLNRIQKNCIIARGNNTWEKRAETIIKDLIKKDETKK